MISALTFPCELTGKQRYLFWEYWLIRSSLRKPSLLSVTGEIEALDESEGLCMSVRTSWVTFVQKYQKVKGVVREKSVGWK